MTKRPPNSTELILISLLTDNSRTARQIYALMRAAGIKDAFRTNYRVLTYAQRRGWVRGLATYPKRYELTESGATAFTAVNYARATGLTKTIDERAAALLNPVLAEAVIQRTEFGIQKYGQRLDDNYQPPQGKAVHLLQELLDAIKYSLWLDDDRLAYRLAVEANDLQAQYGLSIEEIVNGGKQ